MADKKPPNPPAFTPLSELPAPTVSVPDRVLEPFEAKHPGGRPTKYKPEYCDAVIQAGRDGYSLTAFASMIEVDRDTITEWVATHPEFSLAVKRHKSHRAAKWESRLGKIADEGGGNGSATATIFGLKNVAPEEWRDRIEHTGEGGGPIEISWMVSAAAPQSGQVAPGDAARDVTPPTSANVIDVVPEPTSAEIGVTWATSTDAHSSVQSLSQPATASKPHTQRRGEKP